MAIKKTKGVWKIASTQKSELQKKLQAFLNANKNNPDVLKRGFLEKKFGKIEIDGDEKLVRSIEKFLYRDGTTVKFDSKKKDLYKKAKRLTRERPQIQMIQQHIDKIGDSDELLDLYLEDRGKGYREFSKLNKERSDKSVAAGGDKIERGHIWSLDEPIPGQPGAVAPTSKYNQFSQPKAENRSSGGKRGSFSRRAALGHVPRTWVEDYEFWKADRNEKLFGEKNPFAPIDQEFDPAEQAQLHKLKKGAHNKTVNKELNMIYENRANRQTVADFGQKWKVGGKLRTADSVAQIASGNYVGGGLSLALQNQSVQKQVMKRLARFGGQQVAGMAPGAGAAMAALETQGYASQGRWTQAGIAAFSGIVGEIPLVGDAISGAADLTNTVIDITTGNLGRPSIEDQHTDIDNQRVKMASDGFIENFTPKGFKKVRL